MKIELNPPMLSRPGLPALRRRPLHRLLEKKSYDRAINWAYQETLTRYPTTEEMAEARALLSESRDPAEGMADLRWALLNSHEFRYLP